MLPHISFSLENFGEFVFLGEQGRFPLLFRVNNVVKEIVIFYWVKSENQNCSFNLSPLPHKHVGKRSGGGGGLVLLLKWEAAEHSETDEVRWELKSLSSVVFDPINNRMLRARGELCTHLLYPTSISHQNAPSDHKSRLWLQHQALQLSARDTHKMLFNLKLAYHRKTESKEKAARGSCWNKPFFSSLYRPGGGRKSISDINCIQCQDILPPLLTLPYSLWKYPTVRNKEYKVTRYMK